MRVENGVLKLTGQSVRELAKTKEKEFKADIRQKRQQQVEALKTARTQISANKAEILSLQEKMKALNIANSASAAPSNPMFVAQPETSTSSTNPFPGLPFIR